MTNTYKQKIQKCFTIHPDVCEAGKEKAAVELGLGPRGFGRLIRVLYQAWVDGKIDAELLRPYLGV